MTTHARITITWNPDKHDDTAFTRSKAWDQLCGIAKLDCIADAKRYFDDLYDQCHKEWRKELAAEKRAANLKRKRK